MNTTRVTLNQVEKRARINPDSLARRSIAAFKDWGALQGAIALPPAVLKAASGLAAEHYAEAAADDFCGEPVTDFVFPDWMERRHEWMPLEALRALRLCPLGTGEMLLATAGIDGHVDNIHGPCLVVVLHNDGLKFKQGRYAHKTLAGQWYIFDDRREHAVFDGKGTTSYLLWSVPVRQL